LDEKEKTIYFTDLELREIYNGLLNGGINNPYFFQMVMEKFEDYFPDLKIEAEDEMEDEWGD